MNVPRGTTALLLLVAALGAVSTTEGGEEKTNELQISIDAAHPWRPPFGPDRVGRPLTVEVESRVKTRPSVDHVLAEYRDGKVVGRHDVGFPNSGPFIGRVIFEE